jgi:hypothetical protein
MTLTSPTLLRSLVPASNNAAVPPGYALVDDDLSGGLPAVLPLTPRLSVALVLSTGQVRPWLDADPGEVLSEHPAVVTGNDAGEAGGLGDATAPALRLVLLADRQVVGSTPLRAGAARLLPDDGAAPVQVALLALSWRITTGCVVGQGAADCRLRIAWRTVTPDSTGGNTADVREW